MMSSSTHGTEAERTANLPTLDLQLAVGPAGALQRGSFPYRPALDVVRFLAAIWVMLSHAGASKGGGHAVAIFFVLSGFLIGSQLVIEKRRSGTIRLPEFYFKRITRIWIPYFIVLAGMIALFVARGQNAVPGFYDRLVGALTYTYNLANMIHGYINTTWGSFNQIWSLSIEEQFYLVVPLLIAWIPVRSVAPVSLLLTTLFMIVLPIYAGLFVGVLMACMPERTLSGSHSPLLSITLGTAFLAVLGLLFAVGETDIRQDSWITYLLSAIVVLLANFITLPKQTHHVLRYLGLMTYSYYLIHPLPGYFLEALFRRIRPGSGIPLWMHIVFGLLALPLSFLFVRWIELPALRVRGEILKAKSPWINYAPWLAWGLCLVGVIALLYFRPL
jgi:peptidoglycan/LPS O-acetylase OafA/YrhL